MTTAELISSNDLDTSPVEYVAAGIIPRVGTGYVWGPPGSSKSLAFGIELGLSVANGVPWFGRATIAGPVVYVVGEGMGGIGIRKQARLARQARDDTGAIAAVARDHGDAAARALAAALPAYSGDQLYVLTEPFDVRLTARGEISASMREGIALIAALGQVPELVILDAAGDFTGGAGLSNDSVANHFAAGLKALAAELDCVVLVIAHPVANNSKMLGAGRLVAAADYVVEVQPDTAAAPGAAQTATVTVRKSKDGAIPEAFGIETLPCEWQEPERDDSGEPTGRTVTVESATVRLLEQHAPVPAPQPSRSAPAPLPVLAPAAPERPRKRSGIRPRHGLHVVGGDPAPTPVAALLGPQCPVRDCNRPGGMGATCG
jgi:AAA domain